MGVRKLYLDPALVPALLRQPTDEARYRYELEGLPDDAVVVHGAYNPNKGPVGTILLLLQSREWDDEGDYGVIKPTMRVIERAGKPEDTDE